MDQSVRSRIPNRYSMRELPTGGPCVADDARELSRREGARRAHLPGTRMVGSWVSFQLKLVTYSTFSILILSSKSFVNFGAATMFC